jgi:arsenite-transporting ATPase
MLLNKELASETILLEAAEQIFGDTDPAAVLFKDTIFEVKKEEDGYAFILNVPFAEKSDLDMGQKGSELMIQIKNEKRCFTLPDVLRNKTVQSARYEEGKLRIKFA